MSHVAFNYTDSNLISITDKDGKVSQYTYTTNSLLRTAQDIDGYLLEYTYNTLTAGLPNRIQKVVEKVVTEDGDVSGGELTITYAQNQTTFTDVNQNVQILQFNTWGNVISVQDDQGRARYARYATDDAESTEEAVTAAEEATQPTEPKGNQLTLSSKLQNTVGNVLKDSSFENGTNWTAVNGATRSIASGTAYIGSKSQKVTSTAAGSAVGVASASFSVAVGETYTFSAYIKAEASTAYLALHDGTKTVKSEVLAADLGWRRLEVSYTATSAATVTARLMTEDAGTIYMDCVQVEKAPTASRYNLVENGDFRYTTGWTPISGRTTATADAQAPALELSADIYKLDGSMSATNRISQTVNVSGAKDDTFILAGWGKGNSAPLDVFAVQDREFGLILTFNYTDNTTDTFRIHFNPYVDTWQYAASPMVAKKDYRSVTVEVAYDYNVNTAYFDGIQLYKEEFGTSYTYDGEGNIKKVTDVRGETTEYTYDDDNNVTSIELPTETKLTYTYDDYHNVLIATTETGVKYEFGYDAYGNNTSVSITSGENVITSTATYTDDFNRLLSTTDAAGKTTTYSYNADTNVLEWVQYPEDTEATRTRYTYDSMYRLASAAATTSTGSALTASYTYTNDLLTKIQTGSTTYNFTYGSFGLRTEVLVGGNSLAKYVYAHINDPEGTYDDNPISALSKLDYGNEDSVEYTYDTHGRVTQEKYEDGDTVSYKYDNNGALATVTDSATNITTTYYYDFTDRLMKYVESNGTNTHSVSYEYDDINNLTQLVETINGNSYTTSYVYDDDNRVKSVTSGGTEKSYGYDDYGRISSQSVKNDTSSIFTTSYDYLEYTVTKPDNSGTYTAETGQVTELIIDAAGYDVEYAYTYDDNGNILSVTKGTNKTNYTYDSANQLIREDNPAAGKTWVWAYDNAGNIDFRKEYAYTTGTLGTVVDTINYEYGDINRPGWGDLLTTYDGLTIDYDDIGNPLFVKDSENNVVRSYTWEHGRQLAAMNNGASTWYFTYDVNGMRTKRTNNTTTYEYVYNGSQLSQMAITNFLGFDFDFSFFYDANGTPMSFTFNDTMYYYVTNLQGDVVNIINAAGQNLGEYHYDAWGKVVDITQGDSGETDDVFILITNPLFYRGYVFDQESGLYYLQSRYYDPEIGRFINADSFTSTGQGLLGNNMFSYCGNNPVMFVDCSGTKRFPCNISIVAGEGDASGPPLFDSADEAAAAFAEAIYSTSLYIRYEYASEIYVSTSDGITKYYYNTPEIGQPHSVPVGGPSPAGSRLVAYIHTHPNSNSFSPQDLNVAKKNGWDAYVIGPDLILQKYDLAADEVIAIDKIKPRQLTGIEQVILELQFRSQWNSHIADGCAFDCANKTWPTP